MQVVYARCAGLDVHKKTVSACVSVCEPEAAKRQQTRVFGTFTCDLLALTDWLKQQGVTQVAMEATGVYWRPVWAVLEGHFEQMLVNPQHIKAVPGRKSDTKDCEWSWQSGDVARTEWGVLAAPYTERSPFSKIGCRGCRVSNALEARPIVHCSTGSDSLAGTRATTSLVPPGSRVRWSQPGWNSCRGDVAQSPCRCRPRPVHCLVRNAPSGIVRGQSGEDLR